MKKSIKNYLILTLSLLKWLTLSLVCGIVVGSISAGFLHLLNLSINFTGKFNLYFLFLPAVMFVSALTIKYLAPDAEGHGTEKAIAAIHKNNGKVKLAVIPVKLFTTVLTIAGGGSAGKEGPTTQIGAGASSLLASIFCLNDIDRKKLVICGMSAAFASIFGTPIAAAVFAIEVLVVGKLNSSALFPCLLSAIVGIFTGKFLGIRYEAFTIPTFTLNISTISLVALSGIFFGIVALLLILAMKYSEKLAKKLKIFKPLKGLIGGSFLVVLIFIFGKQYCGMGIEYYTQTAINNPVHVYDFLMKIVFTAVTLGWGGSGGILTPIMFIGVTAGNAFANLLGLDISLFACIGMLAVLASATNTPLAAIVMSLELFNPSFAILAAIACPIAYIITGHRSVYPTQLIAESKCSSIKIKDNEEIEYAVETDTIKYGKFLSYISKKLHKKIKTGGIIPSNNDTVSKDDKPLEKNLIDNGILSDIDVKELSDCAATSDGMELYKEKTDSDTKS